MNLRCLLVATLVCVGCLLPARTVAQEKKPELKRPKEIAKATIEAWKKRGFAVGWMGANRDGWVVFATGPRGPRGAVPAFQARPATGEVGLKGLPPVELPFGLDLSEARVTDAGLKELARFKNLTFLARSFTKVTDAGVRELQKALPKCRISE